MNNTVPYLNLGCGSNYNTDWVNLDFKSLDKNVIQHNLNNGIPFKDDNFKVVYNSHLLEHFTINEAKLFIEECYRVLQPGGIIRIVIPDLEKIIDKYKELLSSLDKNSDDEYLNACYDWVMLEMYDQTVRNESGGQMLHYFKRNDLLNKDFIFSQCGYEFKELVNNSSQAEIITENKIVKRNIISKIIRKLLFISSKLLKTSLNKQIIIKSLLGKEYAYYLNGKFRCSGEIHYWMYDKHSISRLLKSVGFNNIMLKTAYESNIIDWNRYNLDIIGNEIRKPDSLFIEARK